MSISSINAYLNGTPGAKHHLGYGMLGRAAFGLWGKAQVTRLCTVTSANRHTGSYFVVMLNVFQSFVLYVCKRAALATIGFGS